MRVLFAVDLDNTLIYSYKRYQEGVCVETKEGKSLSYMTPKAYTLWQQLQKRLLIVPVTTRSVEQYQRIRLNDSAHFLPYALTSNGAVLLKSGQADVMWDRETQRLIAQSQQELQHALALLAKDESITLTPRLVDGAFVYAKSNRVAESLQYLRQQLDLEQVYLDHTAEKLYVLPKSLTKGVALARLKRYFNCRKTAAAGDSSFDLPMLWAADVAIIPQSPAMIAALQGHPQLLVSDRKREGFGEFVLETFARLSASDDMA